jgi:RNA polymerase sigma factor (sigma-70 family)
MSKLETERAGNTDYYQTAPLSELIGRTSLGDSSAFAEIYTRFKPSIMGYLKSRGVTEAEDLYQETMLRAHRIITKGVVDSPASLTHSLYKIARWRTQGYWGKVYKSEPCFSDLFNEHTSYDGPVRSQEERVSSLTSSTNKTGQRTIERSLDEESLETLYTKFRDRITEILSNEQQEVISRFLEGKTADQIASELGISLNTLYSRKYRARKKIEEKILPESYVRVDKLNRNLQDAASTGRLIAVKILGRLYTTRGDVKHYEENKNTNMIRGKIKPEILESGYLPLSEAVPPKIYDYLRSPENRHRILVKGGRYYISVETLKKFYSRHPEMQTAGSPAPNANHQVSLYEAARSRKEYLKLLKAAKRGQVLSSCTRGRYYIKSGDLNAYRNRLSAG